MLILKSWGLGCWTTVETEAGQLCSLRSLQTSEIINQAFWVHFSRKPLTQEIFVVYVKHHRKVNRKKPIRRDVFAPFHVDQFQVEHVELWSQILRLDGSLIYYYFCTETYTSFHVLVAFFIPLRRNFLHSRHLYRKQLHLYCKSIENVSTFFFSETDHMHRHWINAWHIAQFVQEW